MQMVFLKHDSHSAFQNSKGTGGKTLKKSLSVTQMIKNILLLMMYLDCWNRALSKNTSTLLPPTKNLHWIPFQNILITDLVEPDTTKEEIIAATKKMKRGKAPGVDQITFEVLSAGGETIIDMLHKIFDIAWKQEKTPQDFSKMIVSPVHKKELYKWFHILSATLFNIFLEFVMDELVTIQHNFKLNANLSNLIITSVILPYLLYRRNDLNDLNHLQRPKTT